MWALVTARQLRLTQGFFKRCGPPYFFRSRQNWHSRQFSLVHGSHRWHRTLRRRGRSPIRTWALLAFDALPPPGVLGFRRFGSWKSPSEITTSYRCGKEK